MVIMKLNLKNTKAVNCLEVSPDGKWLVVGQLGNDKGLPGLTIWDTSNWKCVAGIETDTFVNITAVSFNRHSDTMAYITAMENLKFFDLKSMEVKRSITIPKASAVCFGRYKNLLLITSEVLTVFDPQQDKVIWTYDHYKAVGSTNELTPEQVKDYPSLASYVKGVFYGNRPAVAVFCEDDTKVMITGNNENKFSVYDLASGNVTAQYPGGVLQADHLITDKAEKYLYVISRMPNADLLWDTKSMERISTKYLNDTHSSSTAVNIHPSSKLIATGYKIGIVSLTDFEKQFLLNERLHKKSVNALDFSKDGNLLISGGSDGKVILTDIIALLK